MSEPATKEEWSDYVCKRCATVVIVQSDWKCAVWQCDCSSRDFTTPLEQLVVARCGEVLESCK